MDQMLVLIEKKGSLTEDQEHALYQLVGTEHFVVLTSSEEQFLEVNDKLPALKGLERLMGVDASTLKSGITDAVDPRQVMLGDYLSKEPETPQSVAVPEPIAGLEPAEQPPQAKAPEPQPEAPVVAPEPQPEAPASQLDQLIEVNKSNKDLPYRLNDDAIPPKEVISPELVSQIAEHYDSLNDGQKQRLAEKLARVKVQKRVQYKNELPLELKQMISLIVLSRDGPAKHMTPSESVFLGEDPPEFGLIKKAPPASIPEDFGDSAQGPSTNYRSPQELMSMLSGDTKKTS